jgi:hypothetical protein
MTYDPEVGKLQELNAQRLLRRHDIPEYHVWRIMNQRCSNPNRSGYHYYGGRGITDGGNNQRQEQPK